MQDVRTGVREAELDTESPSIVSRIVGSVALPLILGCLLAAVEIVALSLSYAALVPDGKGSSGH